MPERLKIAIVDDHPLFRDGVAATLRPIKDFHVLAHGACGDDALRICAEYEIDILLLDVSMPGDGLKIVPLICAQYPAVRVVMLSMSECEEHISHAFQQGAKGYVSKGVSSQDLVIAIANVARGETYLSPRLAASALIKLMDKRDNPVVPKEAARLTRREDQILLLVAAGRTNKEVSQELRISEKTVKHYMTVIMAKLQVRNRVEATIAARAMVHGSKISAGA